MASGSLALPKLTPHLTMRAAVRCEKPIPSPIMMMMFFALSPTGGVETISKFPLAVTVAPLLSVATAVIVCTPALVVE